MNDFLLNLWGENEWFLYWFLATFEKRHIIERETVTGWVTWTVGLNGPRLQYVKIVSVIFVCVCLPQLWICNHKFKIYYIFSVVVTLFYSLVIWKEIESGRYWVYSCCVVLLFSIKLAETKWHCSFFNMFNCQWGSTRRLESFSLFKMELRENLVCVYILTNWSLWVNNNIIIFSHYVSDTGLCLVDLPRSSRSHNAAEETGI